MNNAARGIRYVAHLDEERARARAYYQAHRDEQRARKGAAYRSKRDALPPRRCVECGAALVGCHRNRVRCETCPRRHTDQ
jgi:hypothetical protein